MKQFSLAEKLNRKLCRYESGGTVSKNLHFVTHQFCRDFLTLSATELRQLIVRLMLGSQLRLSATLELGDRYIIVPNLNRWESKEIILLAEQTRTLIFEYGVGILVLDHEGNTHSCRRTGYIAGKETVLTIHNRSKACHQLILNLIDDLMRSSNRCDFLVRLKKHYAPKPIKGRSRKRKPSNRASTMSEESQKQLTLPL
jgi:hypothetical protein